MERAIHRWLGTTLMGLCGVYAAVCSDMTTREQLLHHYTVAVNKARVAHGSPPLKLNRQLCEAAQTYAESLLETGRFQHADAQGRRADYRATLSGYFYSQLGENLAAGALTWERALEMWLQSQSHRANLLNAEYRELGVGFSADDQTRYRTTWTQLLGARRNVYPVIINLDALSTDSPEVVVYVHGADGASAMRYRIGEGAWSSWQTPQTWLRCELPAGEGWRTVTVQLQIGDRLYLASDEIYLQSQFVIAQVTGDRQCNREAHTCSLEGACAGIKRAAGSEHIVQQPHGAPAHLVGAGYLERILHILQSRRTAQPHLRTTVEASAQPISAHRDA
ncbi:MAG: hypothetical protein KatS3mg019_1265 [Fimbriimonadales bacterium]|nr:MAG: hypothetical protein KatS3mg019_1265 [Fimbriimonadales bacterium]